MAESKNQKQTKIAKIVNLGTGKDTIRVQVESLYRHPKYEKLLKEHKSMLVHLNDATKEKYNVGDTVTIAKTKKLSASKSWYVLTRKNIKK
jgi:ribosomal protein S17